MPSVVARATRPVVRAIGSRLAAAETPEQVRSLIGFVDRTLVPATGTTWAHARFGTIDGITVTPKDRPTTGRTVLLFHGGGYVFGSSSMYRPLAARLAKAADATVFVPDYRLAPEHPHPAATDDGMEVYRAVVERVGTDRLCVFGDSAGGGLTLATVQAARRAGLPAPACLVLLSPWLDLTGDADSHRRNVDAELLIRPEAIERCTRWYLAGTPADDPVVSPLFGDLSDLPPIHVELCDDEILADDGHRLAAEVRERGGRIDLHAEDGLWHDWPLMAPLVPEARATIRRIGDFVVRHTD